MKKLFYPLIGILFIALFSFTILLVFNKKGLSADRSDSQLGHKYPGTKWLDEDGFLGASKLNKKTNNLNRIQLVDFAEEINIPDLPALPEIPLTEEDK